MPFVLKARVTDVKAQSLSFRAQKVMYGGKHVSVGDEIFLFDSEHEGGRGLIAAGIVTYVEHVPKERGIDRQTPRVTIRVRRTGLAKGRLGRGELRAFRGRGDGRAETELDFKFYRQATNKIGGISDGAARFLRTYF